jgi:hypothetical protein
MRKTRERPVIAAAMKMMRIEKIDAGTHRTDKSTEKPSNDKSGSNEDERPKDTANDLPCSKNSV